MVRFTTAEVELLAFAVRSLRLTLFSLSAKQWIATYDVDAFTQLEQTLTEELAERAKGNWSYGAAPRPRGLRPQTGKAGRGYPER